MYGSRNKLNILCLIFLMFNFNSFPYVSAFPIRCGQLESIWIRRHREDFWCPVRKKINGAWYLVIKQLTSNLWPVTTLTYLDCTDCESANKQCVQATKRIVIEVVLINNWNQIQVTQGFWSSSKLFSRCPKTVITTYICSPVFEDTILHIITVITISIAVVTSRVVS